MYCRAAAIDSIRSFWRMEVMVGCLWDGFESGSEQLSARGETGCRETMQVY
jgi:hypothetical protein